MNRETAILIEPLKIKRLTLQLFELMSRFTSSALGEKTDWSRVRALLATLILLFMLGYSEGQDLSAPRFFNISMANLSVPQQLFTPGNSHLRDRRAEPPIMVKSNLRYPISLYGRTRIIGEIAYKRQTLAGFYDPTERDDADLVMHQAAFSFMGLHSISDRWNWIGRLSLKNNSTSLFDVHSMGSVLSISQVLERKTASGKIGGGIRFSYRDRLSIIPIFLWQKTLGQQWEIDMLLPAKILFYRNFGIDSRFMIGVKGDASNYYIQDHLFESMYDTNYRRIDINTLLGFEKQVSSMIGLSFEAGATIPVFSGVYSRQSSWFLVHDFQERVTPFARLGVFCSIDSH